MTLHEQESCDPRTWKDPAQVAALTALREPKYARQERWAKEHMITASCRLTKEENAAFRAACRRLGVTRYQVIRFMIAVFMMGVRRERREPWTTPRS